jgi:hypothetical protein
LARRSSRIGWPTASASTRARSWPLPIVGCSSTVILGRTCLSDALEPSRRADI